MNRDELNALYPDAVAYLRARNVEPSDAFYARLASLRQTAWTVKRLATIEQIEAVKQSLVKSLAEGQSFATWRKNTTAEMLALPKHYQEAVFRNATLTSYNGAKWASFRDNAQHRPILRYSAINDSRTRPSHSALHGLMMPVNDPRWQTLAPANGHQCRCTLLSLSERQAKAFGYDGVPEKLPTYEDKHGVEHTCHPDKGWGNTPENPRLLELLREREEKAGLSKAVFDLQNTDGDSTVSPMIKMHRTPWADDFPDTVIDRPLGDATKHPLYEKAKAGDTKSAYLLAKDLVSDEAVEKIRKLKGDKGIVIVPVHAEEAVGKNKIPVAVSAILADRLGVSFNTDIVQAIKVSRTDKDGWHRLANPPMFAGELQKNSLALLVDDTQTQGGTFAALKGHIENNDSRVIGAYALTGKQYSVQLRLSEETLGKLRDEYSSIETWWQDEFGYGFDSLTEWEARYLIKSGKSPDEVRDTILARRLKTSE